MGLTKLQITVEHSGQRLSVLFNPEEYTLNQDTNFASQAIPGLSGPLLQFVHGNMRTLEAELFFDSFDSPSLPKRDVREDMNRIVKLMAIDSELHAPPVLRVSWASLQFRCVLARAAQRFVMFAEDGTPVRARMNVTFNEFIDADRESKEVNRQTADFTKVHVVTEGETITAIADPGVRERAGLAANRDRQRDRSAAAPDGRSEAADSIAALHRSGQRRGDALT